MLVDAKFWCFLMQKTIAMCGNRVALFDNVSEDEGEGFAQREELLCLVEDVVEEALY